MISSRRSFIAGAGALLIASPAIVRLASLMPIKAEKRVFVTGAGIPQGTYIVGEYETIMREFRANHIALVNISHPQWTISQ